MQTQTTEFQVGYLEQKSGRKEDVFYNLHASMHSGRDCGIDSQDVTDQSRGPKSRLTKSIPAKRQNMQAMQRSIECHYEALHKVKITLKHKSVVLIVQLTVSPPGSQASPQMALLPKASLDCNGAARTFLPIT